MELCQSGQVCDPGGVVAELDIMLGWFFVNGSRRGRGADLRTWGGVQIVSCRGGAGALAGVLYFGRKIAVRGQNRR